MFDVLVLIAILWTLWTFVPKVVREAIGMGMRSAARDLWRLLAEAARLLEPVVFGLITGKPRAQIRPKMLDTDMSPEVDRTIAIVADGQTDRQTDYVSADSRAGAVLRLDRSKKAIVKALLLSGWSVSQIRAQLKGDNNALSQEIEHVKKELGSPGGGVEYPSDVEARIKRELAETQAA